jgi:regulator of replication initiation timing
LVFGEIAAGEGLMGFDGFPAKPGDIPALDEIRHLKAEIEAERDRMHDAVLEHSAEVLKLTAELDAERERADRLAAENNELNIELAKWVHYWRDKDNKALAEKVAKLREALEPFAEQLKDNYYHQVDELPIVAGSNKMDIRFKWTLGDLRRARAVLAETKGGGDE